MLCVLAKPDAAAVERLRAAQFTVPGAGGIMTPFHGHITVASYVGDAEEAFLRECREGLSKFPAFTVVYDTLRTMDPTPTVAAIPATGEALTALHRWFTDRFADALDRWTKDDSWVPHTTLLYDPKPDPASVCAEMSASFTPIPAKIVRLEFSRVLGKDSFEIVGAIDLKEL